MRPARGLVESASCGVQFRWPEGWNGRVHMSNQSRVVRVLAALLVSMTAGALVLMALGQNPPSAGPFCLSTYYRLDSVEHAMQSRACRSPNRWDSVEIFFSATHSGSVERLASMAGLMDAAALNCHFVICNGAGGGDGEIQTTEKWQRQWSIKPGPTWQGAEQTIRVCLIGDGISAPATDSQLKRLETLLDSMCREFNIPADSVYLPRDCR